MFDYQIITRERHSSKRWNKLTNYRFTSQDNLVSLMASEAPKAMMWMTLAFVLHENAYVLVGVLGLKQGQNLLVNKEGSWLADYVPATYRSYPFKIAIHEGKEYICIDEQSGLITDESNGTPFYSDEGKASEQLQEYLRFLAQLKADQKNTTQLCEALASKGVIEEWPIHMGGDPSHTIGGLHRINEQKLNALMQNDFIELRDNGALLLAYCQLLSVQNLTQLAKFARASHQPKLQDPSAFSFDQNETISFSKLT